MDRPLSPGFGNPRKRRFDSTFMPRCMAYSPDVTGNSFVAHYTHDPKTFDGFVFPTRGHIHGRDTEGIADQSFAVITVDVTNVIVQR
jgi:hypothetical protein